MTPLFRAREKPDYKFFELKHEPKQTTTFQEFRLSYVPNQQRKSLSVEKPDRPSFKARPMPNFERTTSLSIAPSEFKELTIQKPFNFETEKRLRPVVERSEEYQFKARNVPDFEKIKQSRMVQLSPMKRTTIGVAPMLASEMRSAKRKEFNEAVQQKDLDRQLLAEIKKTIIEA